MCMWKLRVELPEYTGGTHWLQSSNVSLTLNTFTLCSAHHSGLDCMETCHFESTLTMNLHSCMSNPSMVTLGNHTLLEQTTIMYTFFLEQQTHFVNILCQQNCLTIQYSLSMLLTRAANSANYSISDRAKHFICSVGYKNKRLSGFLLS